jgi:hypothetical protein
LLSNMGPTRLGLLSSTPIKISSIVDRVSGRAKHAL